MICQEYLSNSQNDDCQTRSLPIHLSCMENGSCYFCNSRVTIYSNQVQLYYGMKKQAESMVAVTKKILPDINVGDCILVNVDKVDRSPGDPQNIVPVITDIKNVVYRVETTAGVFKSWFNKSDLKKASSTFFKVEQVEVNTFVSVREAVGA